MNERQTVEIMLEKVGSNYGYVSIITNMLSFLKIYGNEVFLYLEGPMVEKTLDKAEQDFPVQQWPFKQSFKLKKDCLEHTSCTTTIYQPVSTIISHVSDLLKYPDS